MENYLDNQIHTFETIVSLTSTVQEQLEKSTKSGNIFKLFFSMNIGHSPNQYLLRKNPLSKPERCPEHGSWLRWEY